MELMIHWKYSEGTLHILTSLSICIAAVARLASAILSSSWSFRIRVMKLQVVELGGYLGKAGVVGGSPNSRKTSPCF